MTVIVTETREITIETETIYDIEEIEVGRMAIAPIPVVVVIVTTGITTIEIGMREGGRMNGIEIEMIATTMIGLTDAGPDMMTTIMTREVLNVEGTKMIGIDPVGILMIGNVKRRLLRKQE